MIRHIVLFRKRTDVIRDAAREADLAQRMRQLGQDIPGILEWRIGANECARPVSWDYVLESAVEDKAALDTYLFHPLHQALVADLKPYFEWAAVDYTV